MILTDKEYLCVLYSLILEHVFIECLLDTLLYTRVCEEMPKMTCVVIICVINRVTITNTCAKKKKGGCISLLCTFSFLLGFIE